MTTGQPGSGDYEVEIKTARITYQTNQIRELTAWWDRKFGCQVREDEACIDLIVGKPDQPQLLLRGRKGWKKIRFCCAKVVGRRMDEATLLDLLERLCALQTNAQDWLGLVVKKDGHPARPIVIFNGELYDQGRMMDMLWSHFAATRIRESKRIQDVYYFLRDVPQF